MRRRLSQEEVMTIGVLAKRGVPKRAIARTLGVAESSVRYRLARVESGAADGRRRQASTVTPFAEAIGVWMAERQGQGAGVNLAALQAWLEAEHGFAGSLRSVQRFVRRHYPAPRIRARRRVETPPGAQGQVDWSVWPAVALRHGPEVLFALHFVLSWSRGEAVVWSERKDLLAWLAGHNAGLRQLGGVPGVLRIDNEKTAIASGAGPWSEVHPAYAAYARTLRFHVDATRPYAPGDKGKVERRIGDGRLWLVPPARLGLKDVDGLQAWTDEQLERRARRRRCPATGTSVAEALAEERCHLGPLPELPEPFDLVANRRVDLDATVRFEGRTYSVPFAWTGQEVELRGCARSVQVWAEGRLVAEHARRTRERILIDPRHYEGPSTDRVVAPVPLGRMGRRLLALAAIAPERRPIDYYAALAEAAR
jgi:transposase